MDWNCMCSCIKCSSFLEEITLFVSQALEEEVQKQEAKLEQQKAQQEEQVVSTIIAELRPPIVCIIQATVAQSDLSNYEIIQTIITQLCPVVLAEVQNALTTSSYRFDASVLTNRIMGRVQVTDQ